MARSGSRAAWLAPLVLGACFHPSYDHPACGPDRECPASLVCAFDNICREADASRDAGSGELDGSLGSTIDAPQCFGSGLVNVCLDAPPTGDVTIAASTIDTSNEASCTKVVAQTGGPDLCVIAARSIVVNGAVAVIGTRALVLVGSDMLVVDGNGTLDASSSATRKGAAANTGQCTAIVKGASDVGGGGGGGGGGLGTGGGLGGVGDADDTGAPAGVAAGGTAGVKQTPVVLRGGCPGSAGGAKSQTQVLAGGAGGAGGGAVYLISGTSIQIAGDVFASGAGGGANTDNFDEGGGGGGAGGMIGLDAPSIFVTGRLAANGGSGGGGGSNVGGGERGADGTTTDWNTRALGGTGDVAPSGNGGNGANGTAGTSTGATNGGNSTAGGGGAAGGLGLILTWGAVAGATMSSPTPITH